jgi:hypothetical protein
MAVRVRVEVWKDELVLTSMESRYESLSEALSPFAIKDLGNFLANKRSMLASASPFDQEQEALTIKERLASFLRYDERAPKGWFTSSQILRIYEEAFGESVRLSTVSTYLASLYVDGILERKGSRAKREYRVLMTALPDEASAVRYPVNNSVSNAPKVQKSLSEI